MLGRGGEERVSREGMNIQSSPQHLWGRKCESNEAEFKQIHQSDISNTVKHKWCGLLYYWDTPSYIMWPVLYMTGSPHLHVKACFMYEHTHTRVCTHVRARVHTHTRVCTCTRLHTRACAHTHTNTTKHAQKTKTATMCMCVCVCVSVCMFVFVCVHAGSVSGERVYMCV